ncbi:MAG: NAD(P)/FAD-dependent oxidoreductase [Anaerolineales bacterium]|jgi:putative flavoprotein involved in K+ transport
MKEKVNTVVVGGGQAGLSSSYHLTRQNREHVVLEKDRIGESWKSKKWDSFTLVTPNWQLRLPGFAYDGDDPDGFLTHDEVAQYVDDYANQFNPPVRIGVEATSVEEGNNGDGFRVETNAGKLQADNVVVATGTFQQPNIPDFSQRISPDVVQMHSSWYRNPEALPPGRCPGGRRRTVGLPDCRGTVPERQKSLPVYQQHQTGSQTLSREGFHLVAGQNGRDRQHGG